MFKKFLTFSLVLMLALSMLPTVAMAEKMPNVIYVATDGKDTNAGTIDAPLATLEAAKSMVRKLRQKGTEDIEVVFRGGDYRILKTVNFTKADSGKDGHPIVYRSYEGEKATFKGSVKLDPKAFKPVTDKETEAILHKNAKGKVLEIDLMSQGITLSDLTMMHASASPILNKMDFNREFNWLFVDNKLQDVSRFPNGGDFVKFYNGTANTFTYEDGVADKWVNDDDWWVYAYSSYDYNPTRTRAVSVNPVTNTITTGNTSPSYMNTWSRGWAAYNLLEEIDIPGEYSIDWDTGKLYYWPKGDISNADIEFSIIGNPVIKSNNLKNVTFKDLGFAQINDDGVQFFESDNVDVIGCDFSGIGWRGLCYNGTKKPKTQLYRDGFYQGYVRAPEVAEAIDAAYNCDVIGNTFYDIGASAIQVFGGNVDTLEPSNNVIEDNFIQRAGIVETWDAIATHGVGHIVQHNNISDNIYHAIRSFGNDSIIRYNEIYDIQKEADDSGSIYISGGNAARGHIVEYNYLHDNNVRRPTYNGWLVGIYFDDTQMGNTANHNIIKGYQTALNSNQSMASTWIGNTAVDCNKMLGVAEQPGNSRYYMTSAFMGTLAEIEAKIHNPKLYYEHYPLLEEFLKKGINPAVHDQFNNNVMVNTENWHVSPTSFKITYGLEHGNMVPPYDVGDDYSQFVDPENQDWRLKADSPAAKANPEALNEDNFDMDLIGMKSEMVFNKETSPFKQVYPLNEAEDVSVQGLHLTWERAYGASRYQLTIAEDKNFENIVYDETVYYSVAEVEGLENGKTYYWKVKAINPSREFNSTWASASPTFSFTTKTSEDVNFDAAEEVLVIAKDMLKGIEEGDGVGMYRPGVRDMFTESIAELQKLVDSVGSMSDSAEAQRILDAETAELDKLINSVGYVNKGYLDLSDYFDAKYWNKPEFVVTDQGVEFGNKSYFAGGTKGLERTGGSTIWCFDAKIDAGLTNDYFCIGLNKDSMTGNPVASNIGYYICFVNGLVEFQNTDGSKQNVLFNKPYVIADGKYHSFQIGVLDVGVGNYVIVNIDGETVYEYMDTKATAQNLPSQLTIHNNRDTSSISFRKSENIPGSEEFDKVMARAKELAALEVHKKFDNYCSNAIIIADSAKGMLTKSGDKALSSAPVVGPNGNLVATKEVVAEILGNVNIGAPATKIDGVDMYDIQSIAEANGKLCTYDPKSNILFIDDTGTVLYLNEVHPMTLVAEFFDKYYK